MTASVTHLKLGLQLAGAWSVGADLMCSSSTPNWPASPNCPPGTVLDGEVVVLEGGKPSLARLQQRAQLSNPARIEILSKRRPVTLMVFDLLYLRHRNVMAQPLVDRRGRVQELIERLGNPHVLAPSYVLEHGRHYFAEIERHGLEGVMAKRLDSPYSPGRRLPDWLKIKVATYLRGTARSKQSRAIAQP